MYDNSAIEPYTNRGLGKQESVREKSTTIPLIAMQGYHTKTEDTGSLDYNSICYITGFTSSIDVDVILENCQ